MDASKGESRRRIVEVLKRRGRASVAELSAALGLTPVTIRHHLEALIEDQVVSPPESRRKPGPGRPEMVYALTGRADRLTPRNYAEMCECLLRALDADGLEQAERLRLAGRRLADRAGAPVTLEGAAEFLDARGYFPTVELAESGATIVLASCPYLEVARADPGLCQFDLGLLEALLGEPVIPETSIARHDPACRLRLAARASV